MAIANTLPTQTGAAQDYRPGGARWRQPRLLLALEFHADAQASPAWREATYPLGIFDPPPRLYRSVL
jgi:hypothetical protein